MKYNILISRLKPMRAIVNEKVDFKNKKISIVYHPSTLSDEKTNAIYDIEFSKELEDLLKVTGEEYGRVKYVDKDEETVIAYPDYYINYKGYKSWKGDTTYFILYNDKVIYKEVYKIINRGNTTIKGYLGYVSSCVDVWKENLIAIKGEYYVFITPNGEMKKICYSDEPESGRDDHKKSWIEGDKFNYKIYEYCDCDLKHGDWNEQIYDLNEYLK